MLKLEVARIKISRLIGIPHGILKVSSLKCSHSPTATGDRMCVLRRKIHLMDHKLQACAHINNGIQNHQDTEPEHRLPMLIFVRCGLTFLI
jgi:hypothetical protein